MTPSKVLSFFLVLLFWPNLSWTEATPLPKYVPASIRAPDLDLANDLGRDSVTYTNAGQVGVDISYRPWVYWGLGLAVVGGGITFLILEQSKPTPTK